MKTLTTAIKDYFKGLIEQGKQEVDILEANAEIHKIIDGMEGRLIELPISIENAVDKLFSHNELISLWRKTKENGVTCHKRIWYGMAWNIPKELKKCKFVKIFGTIPESIDHADIINIEVLLSAEAEKTLEEMEK